VILERGAVYVGPLELPNREPESGDADALYETRTKLLVVLQGGARFEWFSDVATVVASSLRTADPERPFELYVGTADGFRRNSVIDCRWPYTVPKDLLGRKLFLLPPQRMHQIAQRLANGLQMIASAQ
jgi:mRNA-degrading endonuclease toxin of MazEF toxin-antitoxin module